MGTLKSQQDGHHLDPMVTHNLPSPWAAPGLGCALGVSSSWVKAPGPGMLLLQAALRAVRQWRGPHGCRTWGLTLTLALPSTTSPAPQSLGSGGLASLLLTTGCPSAGPKPPGGSCPAPLPPQDRRLDTVDQLHWSLLARGNTQGWRGGGLGRRLQAQPHPALGTSTDATDMAAAGWGMMGAREEGVTPLP